MKTRRWDANSIKDWHYKRTELKFIDIDKLHGYLLRFIVPGTFSVTSVQQV